MNPFESPSQPPPRRWTPARVALAVFAIVAAPLIAFAAYVAVTIIRAGGVLHGVAMLGCVAGMLYAIGQLLAYEWRPKE